MAKKRVLAPALVPVVGRWAEQPQPAVLKDLQDKLEKVADVEANRPASPQDWAKAIKHVNVIAGGTKVDEDFLKSADELEMIQVFGIGYDYVDVKACTKKGVIVCNVAEIYSESVAQHTWAQILDLTKNITRADRSMRAGKWEQEDWMGFQLWGKPLGVIGLGSIGSRVATKGRLAFGMRILAYDPYLLPERAQLFGAELVDLETLLKESDVVSINVPLTAQTRHMIGEEQLSMMKKSAFLVNTCRGPIVDERALVECLRRGSIRGAGLDVFEIEPLPRESHLLRMENVVLTPHIASSTKEAVEQTYRGAVENIVRYLKGLRPHWITNPKVHKG